MNRTLIAENSPRILPKGCPKLGNRSWGLLIESRQVGKMITVDWRILVMRELILSGFIFSS